MIFEFNPTAVDIILELINKKQPDMNKVVLDLNGLDLCSIDQLEQIKKLIEQIRINKEVSNNESIKEKERVKERVKEQAKEKKEEKHLVVEAKRKAFEAIQLRIAEQEKFLTNQRLLLSKIWEEYKLLRSEYNKEYLSHLYK